MVKSLTTFLACAFCIPALAQFNLSCDSFCVLNVEMNTTYQGFMNVTMFNGNTNSINYPTVQVIDNNTNDTIGNPEGTFDLFAQPGNTTVTYMIPSTVDSLPEPLTLTVLITDQIWDSTCVLPYPCTVATVIQNLSPLVQPTVQVSNGELIIGSAIPIRYYLFDIEGICALSGEVSLKHAAIENTSRLPSGVYLLYMISASDHWSQQLVIAK